MSLVSVFMLMFSAAPVWATTLEWDVPAELLVGGDNGVLVPLSRGLLGPLGDAPSFTSEDGETLSFEAEREQGGEGAIYWVHLPALAPRTVIRVAAETNEEEGEPWPEDLLGLWHLNGQLGASVGESLAYNPPQDERYSDLGIIGSLVLPNVLSFDASGNWGAASTQAPPRPYTVSVWVRASGGFLMRGPSFYVRQCDAYADGIFQSDGIKLAWIDNSRATTCLPADYGVWHLVTVTVTDQQHTIWVDDEPAQSIEGFIADGQSEDLWMSTLTDGVVDELRIYSGERSLTEHLLAWTLVKEPPFAVVPQPEGPPMEGSPAEGLPMEVPAEDTGESFQFGWSSGCSHSRSLHGSGWAAMLVWMLSRRSLR